MLHNALSSNGDLNQQHRLIQEQVTRLEQILNYQLNKLSIYGGDTVIEVVKVAELLQQITSALQKVYYNKDIKIEFKVPSKTLFWG